MLPWRLLTNSLKNMSFGMKHDILNVRNMQSKLLIQNRLQQKKKEPTRTNTELIKNTWISKNKVKQLLGFFATTRLIQDWKAAEPNEVLSRDCTWDHFLTKFRYKPTENPIIRNLEFRQLVQVKKVCQQKNVSCVDNTEKQKDVTQEATEMETCQFNI